MRSGKTLHLVTLACNVHLRGSEISDPNLDAAKTMVRRAGEVLGRLEDAVVFHGIPEDPGYPTVENLPVIRPVIYTVTGGRDLTGLLHAPDTLFDVEVRSEVEKGGPSALEPVRREGWNLVAKAKQKGVHLAELAKVEDKYWEAESRAESQLMSVKPRHPSASSSAIVDMIVRAILKLEGRGHFGPFAVVLGDRLFIDATTPTKSLVLPSDRLAEFLDGRRILRSSILPERQGVVVALGGQPIELVLATDIDVRFLQVTLEPRYVLRVFERLVLRIKELDAVCRVTSNSLLLDPYYIQRRARS